MTPRFFGLSDEYKIKLHEDIAYLAYFGNGFTWTEIYFDMPVYLRNFYITKIAEIKKKETSNIENSTKKDQFKIPKELFNPKNFKPSVKSD